jgi:hypothetical protein
LKKRTKKLFSFIPVRTTIGTTENQIDKSFLVLFFKKELLPSVVFGVRWRIALRLSALRKSAIRRAPL